VATLVVADACAGLGMTPWSLAASDWGWGLPLFNANKIMWGLGNVLRSAALASLVVVPWRDATV
jgi:hypothetical protein